MTQSNYKTSFMIDQDLIDEFLSFLQEQLVSVETTSPYQRGRFDVEGRTVLIYQSGIVIFEEHQVIRDSIQSFLDLHGISNPDFEQYQSNNSQQGEDGAGWDETPKGVWLTSNQISALREVLEKTLDPQPGGDHEICRYHKNGQILVVNANSVVYTIGGFDGILALLERIIRKHNPYQECERIVIVDEQGRWDRIGPYCLVVVECDIETVIQLQLAGIKDHAVSRSIDHLGNIALIEDRCTYNSLVITPEEINSVNEDRREYRPWISRVAQNFFNNQNLEFTDKTLLIVDELLEKNLAIEHNPSIIVRRKQRTVPAVGISSTITNASIAKWADDWYHTLSFRPERHNLERIRNSTHEIRLAKSFLL